MNWCISTHIHTHMRARGGGGGYAQAHTYMHISKQNLSISLPSSLSLSLTSPVYPSISMLCTHTFSRKEATAYAWMETCTFQIFWSDRVLTVLFLAINRFHNHFPLQTCCFAHWKCFFFTMPYLSLNILIIIDCRCQYPSFFSFSFLVLLKVFVNGGNDSRTHCSHNFFTMTACAMITKSTEGKIENTTVACVPFFPVGQKNNT